jgi:hypothetical protein
MVCLLPDSTATGSTDTTTTALYGTVTVRDCDMLAPSLDEHGHTVESTIGVSFEEHADAVVQLLCGEAVPVLRSLVMASTSYFSYK